MLNWNIIYTKPKNEDVVSCKLSNAGLKVLNPKLKERKYYRRKIQDIVSPLFPCYIFVEFDYPNDYHLIKYTRGVRRIIDSGNMPAVVPEEIITVIQDRMREGVITLRQPQFHAGEEVTIIAGPFHGFSAIFEREMKGPERVSILLNTINARMIVDSTILARNN